MVLCAPVAWGLCQGPPVSGVILENRVRITGPQITEFREAPPKLVEYPSLFNLSVGESISELRDAGPLTFWVMFLGFRRKAQTLLGFLDENYPNPQAEAAEEISSALGEWRTEAKRKGSTA